MTPTLCITRWSETFENADTRKRERLKFFHAPSGCDSNGYLELMTCHQSAGLVAFGVFQALCQHSATLPAKNRGKFVKSNGSAMTLTQIALLLRIESATLADAVEILTQQEIGWLHWSENKIKSASDLPVICRQTGGDSADEIPPTAGFVQGQGQGQGQDHHHQEKKNGDDDGDDWGNTYPTAIADRMSELQKWLNSLNPSWTKRPHFSAKELHALNDNAKAWLAVSTEDRSLLKAYMFAVIPDEWRKDPRDFFQPDNRLGLIGIGPSSILSVADKWVKACKRHNVPTGIVTNELGLAIRRRETNQQK